MSLKYGSMLNFVFGTVNKHELKRRDGACLYVSINDIISRIMV